MNLNFRKLTASPGAIWALALLACSTGSFFAGSLSQEQALPAVVERVEKLQAALAAQDEEFERARVNAERRIAALAVRVAEMKAALVQMDSWGNYLGELRGEPSFTPASVEFAEPSLDFEVPVADGGIGLIAELNFLTARVNQRFDDLRIVADALAAQGAEELFAPSGWPVETRYITSRHGFRKDPFTGMRAWHAGIDIDGEMGDPIYAVASGVVTWAGNRSTYGQLVEVSHAGGYTTRYAHNSLNLVEVGDYVQRGQEIARIGRSGRVTGSSLHFEVLRNGVSVNPIEFLHKGS